MGSKGSRFHDVRVPVWTSEGCTSSLTARLFNLAEHKPSSPPHQHLFLDRELAETLDPRDDRTSAVRSRLLNVLMDRMHGPPVGDPAQIEQGQRGGAPLPPLSTFGNGPRGQSLLTPITERSSVPTRENTIDGHYEAFGSPALSAADHDSPMRGITSVISTSLGNDKPASPALSASLPNGAGPPDSNGAVLDEASISAPQDPILPTTGSQGYAPGLPTIPGSTTTSPPATTPAASSDHRNSPVPAAAARTRSADSEQFTSSALDSQLSPSSFARSLWSDGPSGGQQQPQQRSDAAFSPRTQATSPEPLTGVSRNSPYAMSPAAVRQNSGSSIHSLERPPSLKDQPRGPSPLRTSSIGPQSPNGQQQLYQPPLSPPAGQRVTSPLAQPIRLIPTSPSTHSQSPPPSLAVSTNGQMDYFKPGAPSYAPTAIVTTGNGNPNVTDQSPPEMSPRSTLTHHSYPAQAQVQNPDIYEPQPQQSRNSHTVLNAPFIVSCWTCDVGERKWTDLLVFVTWNRRMGRPIIPIPGLHFPIIVRKTTSARVLCMLYRWVQTTHRTRINSLVLHHHFSSSSGRINDQRHLSSR